MANPYKDEKTGKFITKADFLLQEKMRKSSLANLEAQEESLKVQKEIAAANKAGNSELAKQLELERNKNIELAKQLKAKKALNDSKGDSKGDSKSDSKGDSKGEETAALKNSLFKDGNKELLESHRLQELVNKSRFDALSYDEKQIDLAKIGHQILKKEVGTRSEAKSLSQQIIDDMESESDLKSSMGDGQTLLRSEADLEERIIESKSRGKDLAFEVSQASGAGLAILKERQTNQNDGIEQLRFELKMREGINEKMGVMDNVMGGLNNIPFLKQFIDGEEAVHMMEQSLARGGTAGEGLAEYMSTMKKDAFDIAMSFIEFDSVKDVGKFLWNTMMAVNEETTKLSKDMGLSNEAATGMRVKMADIAMESGKMAITTHDTLVAMNTLNDQFGVASTVIRNDVIGEITSLTKLTGMSAEAAGRFATTMMSSGQAASTVTEAARETVRQTANEFGVRLNVNAALEEAGKITGEMAANMGYNVVAITKAVATAKQLGMTLEGVASSGKAMLDFQSSIEAELQAELFTGKQLNLEKARLAALTGDYETLTREINANMADEHEWSTMNVLAKEKMAAALGMNSDQMSDIIYKNKNLAALAAEARENGDYAAAADLEKRSTQEKMNDLMTKASSIVVDYLAPALDVVANMLAGMADNSGLMYAAIAAIGLIKLGGLISGAMSLAAAFASVSTFSVATMSAWTLGIGALAIIGGIAAVAHATNKAKKEATSQAKTIDDGFISPDGGLQVSGEKGTIQLHPDDSVAVGTDLLGENIKPKNPTTPIGPKTEEESIPTQMADFKSVILSAIIKKEEDQKSTPSIQQNLTKNIVSVMSEPNTNEYKSQEMSQEVMAKKQQDFSNGITENLIAKRQQDLSIRPTEEKQTTLLPMKKISDGIIDSSGALVVSGEKGSIQLDPEDQIATGTDLGGSSAGSEMDRKNYAREERFQAESIALLKKISVATAASGVGSLLASISYSGFDAVKADTHYGTKFR